MAFTDDAVEHGFLGLQKPPRLGAEWAGVLQAEIPFNAGAATVLHGQRIDGDAKTIKHELGHFRL